MRRWTESRTIEVASSSGAGASTSSEQQLHQRLDDDEDDDIVCLGDGSECFPLIGPSIYSYSIFTFHI